MCVVFLALFTLTSGLSLNVDATQNPISRVVELIRDLQSKIESDGKSEQKVYDKYACWCEATTARKAAAIEEAKNRIEELSKNIVKLNGRLGSATAEIAQLEKNIAETKETILKATEMRTKEHEEYLKTKGALEQAIGNLERAIEVLGKLPGSPKGFKDAKQGPMGSDKAEGSLLATNVLTVAAGLRSAVHLYEKSDAIGKVDMGPVQHLLANPGSLISTGRQVGTYNTQSTVIQGILSQMHETMVSDLASAKEEEEAKAANFEDLMKTKNRDLELLQSDLLKKNQEHGTDTLQLADDQKERAETQAQLKTDEAFFATTTDSCKARADEWANRSRLRTEELSGIGQAIAILTSDEAKETFNSATTTFVQTGFDSSSSSAIQRNDAYGILKATATATHSMRLAQLAATVKTTGHFDAVLADIKKMIVTLREEEQADVKHKDWCETQKHSAGSKNENLEYSMEQLKAKADRLDAKASDLTAQVAKTEGEMRDLEVAMKEALDNRNTENAAHLQAVKDDTDAVALIQQAIGALSKFYTNNDLALIAKKHHKQEPEYKANEDTAPAAVAGAGSYGGAKSQNTGIVAILGMIAEDLTKEIAQGKEDEAAALAAYRQLFEESTANMQALEDKKTTLTSDIAAVNKEISDTNAVLFDTEESKASTDAYLDDLAPNCDWVERTFETRRTARKAEIEGLQSATSVLAGASAGAEAAEKAGLTAVSSAERHRAVVAGELDDLEASEKQFLKK